MPGLRPQGSVSTRSETSGNQFQPSMRPYEVGFLHISRSNGIGLHQLWAETSWNQFLSGLRPHKINFHKSETSCNQLNQISDIMESVSARSETSWNQFLPSLRSHGIRSAGSETSRNPFCQISDLMETVSAGYHPRRSCFKPYKRERFRSRRNLIPMVVDTLESNPAGYNISSNKWLLK
jgi:hypothetical protein